MFTGIIQCQGRIAVLDRHAGGCRVRIECPELEPGHWREGDSVAVAGCCLTVLNPDAEGFSADLSGETLERTGLGDLGEGDRVNLEPALAAGDRLGGHLVTGHVDGLARLVTSSAAGDSRLMRFRVPADLSRFLAEKGSITLDGVSLTINSVIDREFEVNLIPHTLNSTTLGALREGDRVNAEVDLVARYLDRLLEQRGFHAV